MRHRPAPAAGSTAPARAPGGPLGPVPGPQGAAAVEERSVLAAAWLAVAAVLGLWGLARGDPALVAPAAALLAYVGLSYAWIRLALADVRVHATAGSASCFAGDAAELVLTVENAGWLPQPWVRTRTALPAGVEPARDRLPASARVVAAAGLAGGELVDLWHLPPRSRVRRRYVLHCPQRGIVRVAHTEVAVTDPLGLFRAQRRWEHPLRICVYPRPAALAGVPWLVQAPDGPRPRAHWLDPDPTLYAGARPYRPGDPWRWLDWRATARRRELQVKVFDSSRQARVAVVVDVRPFARAWQGAQARVVEHTLSVAAALLLELDAARCRVRLLTNAARPGTARAPRQPLTDQLEELAFAQPLGTVPPGALASEVRAWEEDVVVVVTPLADPSVADLLTACARGGRRVLLLATGTGSRAELDPAWRAALGAAHRVKWVGLREA